MEITNSMGQASQEMLAAGGIGMVLGWITGVSWLLSFAWWVIQVIANWRIFSKAGEKGWKSIIPFYNLYVQYKLVWTMDKFWKAMGLLAGSSLLGTIGSGMLENSTGIAMLLLVVALVLTILYAIIDIKHLNRLARSFGYGTGFTVGLVLLNPIFILILGFGKCQYIGNTSTGTNA